MALESYEQILRDTIEFKLRHKDYTRVNELAKKYKQLITGEGIEEQLRQFVRREDDDLFEQRKLITKQITPAVMNSIMKPAYKIPRCDNVKSDIFLKDEKASQEIIEKANKFYGDISVNDYLATRFIQLDFIDPNSFLVIEFDPFDSLNEKASPRPFEVSSEMAVNYKYKNNILQWLIVKECIDYKDKDGKLKEGEKYTMYLEEDIIVYTEIDYNVIPIELPENSTSKTVGDKRKFIVTYATPNGGRVQAERIGHELDLVTDGRTFVSPAEPAMPWLEKSIKHVSEMDLSVALHVFPQKAIIAKPCLGESDTVSCRGGINPLSGKACSVCGGTGTTVHKSTQDVLQVPEPRQGDEFPDLSKYIAYFTPDIALIKWMEEYVDKLEYKAIKAVYNSETFKRDEVQKTATGENVDLQNVYDTLYPIGEKFSKLWVFVYQMIAIFTDNDSEDLILIHRFPRDFKFKSESEYIQDLKTANDSGAPAFLKQEITWDIAMVRYRDDPESLRKYEVRNYFMPFLGKSFQEIQFILTTNRTTKYYDVLWSNFDNIFDELEKEIKDFYSLKYSDQEKYVNEKVDQITNDLSKANAVKFTVDAQA